MNKKKLKVSTEALKRELFTRKEIEDPKLKELLIQYAKDVILCHENNIEGYTYEMTRGYKNIVEYINNIRGK